MVTILEDDSVQEICASLGLGEVPLLNAENRELNRQLQELQIQLQRNKQKIKEEAKQLEIYEDHIRTVKEATKLNQELVKAKKEEISAEKNLLKVQEVLQERLLKDKRSGEKRLLELDEEAEKYNEEIEDLQETIKNTQRIIDEEFGNKLEWADALKDIDNDLSKLSKYFQADEVKIKDLSLKLVKMREKVKVAREELKNASTRSKMAQLALDKSAEEFREAHKERHEVVKQWESSIELLGKRDAEIEVAANEVERVKNVVKRREIDLQEQVNFFNNEVGNIEELKKKIRLSEKKAQNLKEKLIFCEEEKKTYENEVALERRQILKLSWDIDKNRTKLIKMKKDKVNNIKKLNHLNEQIKKLEIKKKESNEKVLTSEEKVQEVENILMVYDKQHDQLKNDLEKQKIKRLNMEKELRNHENEQDIANLEMKSVLKEQAKLKSKIKEIQEQLQKKEDILYHSQFDLAKLERHNAKASGKSPDENRSHLKEELSILKTKLEEQNSAKRSIDNLIYKLEVSIGRSRKEIQQLNDVNEKKQEEINETELIIDTSTRHASALRQEIQELTVEDKMLSMTEIKIKDEIKLIQKEIVEIERFITEDEATGREKLSGFNSAREMYEGQVRCIQGEIDDLNHQIQLRDSRKEKMKIKHETIFKSLGKMEDENGELIPSHAYYLVKLAQEKAELKDQTLILSKKIKKEETELAGLQKALEMIRSSNSDFRIHNLRKKSNTEEPELTELRKEEKEKKDKIRELVKAEQILQKEISIMEKSLYQLRIDLENLKSIQEEKEETLRVATRSVLEEEKKLDRAKNTLEKYKNDLKEGSARSLIEYETDMDIRLQREKQASTVQKLRDMCKYNEELGYAVGYLLDTLELIPTSGSDAKKTKGSAKKSQIKIKEVARDIPTVQAKVVPSGDSSPKWQVAQEKPRLI